MKGRCVIELGNGYVRAWVKGQPEPDYPAGPRPARSRLSARGSKARRRLFLAVDRVIRGDTSDQARRWVRVWSVVAGVRPRGVLGEPLL